MDCRLYAEKERTRAISMAVKSVNLTSIHGPHPTKEEEDEDQFRGLEHRFASLDPRLQPSWRGLPPFQQCSPLFLFSRAAVCRVQSILEKDFGQGLFMHQECPMYAAFMIKLTELMGNALGEPGMKEIDRNHFNRIAHLFTVKPDRFLTSQS